MKKLVLIFITFILSTSLCFADSVSSAETSAELPQSALLPTVTDENEIAIDTKLREASALLAANSEYTANDIYTLLNACRISINGNTNLRVYDSSVVDAVNALQPYISYVNDSLNATGYGSIADLQVDTLTAINNVLSTLQYDTDTETLTVIDILRSILVGQVSESQFATYATAVAHRWLSEDYQFSTISNSLSSIETALNTLHSDLSGVTTAINTNGSILHTDFNTANNNIANILSTNQHIDSDMHDLKQWLNDTFYYSVDKSVLANFDDYYYRPSRIINSYPFVSSSNLIGNMTAEGSLFYPLIPLNSYIDRFYIDNLSINSVNSPSVAQIRIYDSSFNLISSDSPSSPISISFEQYDDDTVCVVYNGISSSLFDGSNNFAVFVPLISSYSWDFSFHRLNNVTEFTPYIYTVNIDSKSYYQDYKETLDKFKDLYASDDLIAAKEAQQSTESQVLSDFTGSGSAAVTTNDIGLAKDTSTALSNGLNTGVSASEAFKVFNPENSLFSWFSTTTRDNLSTDYEWLLILPNRRLKSVNNDNGTMFYDDNLSEYERGVLE